MFSNKKVRDLFFVLIDKKRRIIIIFMWILHIIAPTIMMVYDLISMPVITIFGFLTVFTHRVIQPFIFWFQPFVTFFISLSATENLEELRRILESDKRAETICFVRKRFVEIRNTIIKFDNSMSMVNNNTTSYS